MEKKKKLYLHIGHGKTGSSYIQATLAMNLDSLGEHAISYPVSDRMVTLAKEQRLSYGNGRGILASPEKLRKWLSKNSAGQGISTLASSEWLFNEFYDLPQKWGGSESVLETMKEISKDAGFEMIEILLFVRSPSSFIPSFWKQRVKKHSETRDLVEFANSEDCPRYASRAVSIIEMVENDPFFRITVNNYDCSKEDILAVFRDWLGIPAGTFKKPSAGAVNRSLTRGELELQRQINKRINGNSEGKTLADRFYWELPDLRDDHTEVTPEVLAAVWDAEVNSIEKLNEFLADRQKLVRPQAFSIREKGDTFEFCREQLEIIAETISASHNRAIEVSAAQLDTAQRLPATEENLLQRQPKLRSLFRKLMRI